MGCTQSTLNGVPPFRGGPAALRAIQIKEVL